MVERRFIRWAMQAALAIASVLAAAPVAHAQTTPQGPKEWLCDASYQNCRTPLIDLIRNESVGIDVAFWFMQDARFKTEIIKRWQAGVPVRMIVDPKANPTYPGNDQMLADFAAAGIPMRQRTAAAPGILHWKTMLFAGQNVVEFSGANFSPTAFVPQAPYSDFEDETIYFSDDPQVVQTFMTEYDDPLDRNAVLLGLREPSESAGAPLPDLSQGPGAQFSAGGRLRHPHPEAVSEGAAANRRDHVPHHGRTAYQRADRRDAARDSGARPERHEGIPPSRPSMGFL